MELLSAEQIVEKISGVCGEGVLDTRIDEWKEGLNKTATHPIWMRVDVDRFRPAVQSIMEIQYPHLGVISGTDLGEHVELLYHFFIYYGIHLKQQMITIAVPLPKDKLEIPTICDLIPGALTSEREKQEMLGVKVVNIPDERKMFLEDDFPEGVYPWRKDETGIPEDMIKQLWKVGRSPELLDEKEPEKKAAPKPAAAATESSDPAPQKEKASAPDADPQEENNDKPADGEQG